MVMTFLYGQTFLVMEMTISQPIATLTSIFKTGVLNGFLVVRFNKSNGRLRRTSFTGFPTSQITAIYVNRNNENSDGALSYASTVSNNNFLLFSSNNLRFYRGGVQQVFWYCI